MEIGRWRSPKRSKPITFIIVERDTRFELATFSCSRADGYVHLDIEAPPYFARNTVHHGASHVGVDAIASGCGA